MNIKTFIPAFALALALAAPALADLQDDHGESWSTVSSPFVVDGNIDSAETNDVSDYFETWSDRG